MAEGKDKFDINNDQKLKQDNLDKSDGPIAKTEILDGQPEHGIHDTEERADADFRPGNENFDINNDQKIAFDKSDGPGGDAENYNAGTNWVKTDTPIHDTEERADADLIPGDVPKVELNQGLGDYVKDGDNLSSDHIAKTEILDGQPEQGILAQANGAPNVSGDVVNMADMHSHMDDAAEHQVPEGPPQNPQAQSDSRWRPPWPGYAARDWSSHRSPSDRPAR